MATERLLDDASLVECARAMRAAGATYKQIKSELKVGTRTVSRLLGTTGQDRKPRIAAEIRARAETMRAAGRSIADIVQELDIARSTAWHLIRGTPPLSGTSSAIGAVRANRPGVRRSNKIRRQQTKHRWAQHVGDLSGRELLLVGAAI
jgi:orotate phosphoribosyltransferase-like protein